MAAVERRGAGRGRGVTLGVAVVVQNRCRGVTVVGITVGQHSRRNRRVSPSA